MSIDSSPDPGDAAQPSAPKQQVLRRLLRYARPYLWLIVVAMLLSTVFSAGRYGRAYLIKPIFDDVITPSQALRDAGGSVPFDLDLSGLAKLGGGDSDAEPAEPETEALDDAERHRRLEKQISQSLSNVIAIAVLIIVLMPLVMFAREYTVHWAMGRINLDMKVEVCRKLLALPLRFHHQRRRGDLFARLMGDVNHAHNALNLLFGDLIEAVIMLVLGGATLLLVSWKLSMVMLLVGPGIFATISIFGRRIKKSARRRQRQFADVTARLVEILEGIKVIKAFRAEGYESSAFARASHRLFRRGMKVVVNRVMARTLVDALNNAAVVGVLVLGIYLVLGGHWGVTMGDLAAFAAISITIYRPVRTLARGWAKLMDAQPSAERFFEVLDSPIEIHEPEDAVALPRIRESIRFHDVSFSYDRDPVLLNVGFEVAAGQVLAIVGRTGAGKTTLVDLLLRFYDPTSGRIEIDGVDLRRARRDDLLDQMAVVSQEPFLFDGSIRENILYGRPGAGEEEMLSAARAAHVDEFVATLPQGYDTEVGAAGTRLSGGQRQRVTIARAILRDPAILILDEATSALDSKSERLVQDAIERLLPGRTVFVIAHRLSTVRKADQILVLEGGRVSQLGNHEALVAEGGLYRELVELQDSDGAPAA